MIDAFEAAAGQVKADTEGEQRIAGSYQVRCNRVPEQQGTAMRSHVTAGGPSQLCTRLRRSHWLGQELCRLLLQGLYAKMVEAFKKMGLEVVPGVGMPFDPEVGHQSRLASQNSRCALSYSRATCHPSSKHAP